MYNGEFVADRLRCSCGEHPVLHGYCGNSYWWCRNCSKEVGDK